ncbi:MAG: hypothetical protein GWP61_18710 [Chloroflexi bacterium]|jgi:hypothetical protein|nr:hypothetical protein [Chloroflexota bacterium]
MNKKFMVKLVLIAALLMALSVASVWADSARKITGGMYSLGFFIVEQGWFNFNVHEVDPASGEAGGSVHWKEYDEEQGWRFVQAHPICVAFGQYGQNPAATFVVKVDSIRGWRDPAEFEGELMKFWVVDGGTPGRDGDYWSSVGPWPPTDNLDDYGCHYQDPFFQFAVDGGNLTIHD